MALSDGIWSVSQVEKSAEHVRQIREARERAAAVAAARASEVRKWVDDAGTTWSYVVLDGTQVRIEHTESALSELTVPSVIEGRPVVALGDDACSNLSQLQRVVVPDSVVSIGFCAFRNCSALKSAVLSQNVSEYDSGWFRNCVYLEELTLPGKLEQVRPNIFDTPLLKRLHIGAGTSEIYPGTFGKGKLEEISIDPANEALETDGIAIYTKGRASLVAVAARVESYAVAPECTAVFRKAMDRFTELREVVLPDGISLIGSHAFSHTGITRFDAPQQLRAIYERAFFDCQALSDVTLNDGLEAIGENAFTKTALRALRIPATVTRIGHPVVADTHISFTGPDATFSIESGGILSADETGGMYRACDDGMHFEWLLDPDATEFSVASGTMAIEPRAFLNHRAIERVVVPASARTIGDAAFKGCHHLRQVDTPEGLEAIGEEAFLDTSLEALYLPESLRDIGAMALITRGAHSGRDLPSLRDVQVAPGNERYLIDRGMLMERQDGDRLRVVIYLDTDPDVFIPDEVSSVAPYAFSGARGISRLRLLSSLKDIGIRAFAIEGLIDTIRIDMVEPVEGHRFFEICFPDTDRGIHQLYVALTAATGFDVASLYEHYDVAIANASSFDAILGEGGLDLYEQAKLIIARLLDPIFMTAVNEQMLRRTVQMHLGGICVALAKHDDRRALDELADLSFLSAKNISQVIDRVGAVQDAAVTGYLLEMRRHRFGIGGTALDFEI